MRIENLILGVIFLILATICASQLVWSQTSEPPTTVGEKLHFYRLSEACRIVDTRIPSEAWCTDLDFNGILDPYECAPLAENGILQMTLAGDSTRVIIKGRGYEDKEITIGDQGGTFPDGCGIPRDAKAVNMMLAVVPLWPNERGHVRVWPFEVKNYIAFGGSIIPIIKQAPHMSTLNFSPNETAESTWFIQPICDRTVAKFGDCGEDISVSAQGSPVHVVIDVNGYFK